MGQYEAARDFDGSQMFSFGTVGPHTLIIDKQDLSPPGTIGRFSCHSDTQGRLIIDEDCDVVADNGRCFKLVFMHEMMHALGGEHGGRWDSFAGVVNDSPGWSRTTTCQPRGIFPTTMGLSQDDLALLNWLAGGEPTWS